MSQGKQILALLAFLTVAFLPGIVGMATVGEIRWLYTHIAKPEWSPAGWAFAPVWTVLYAMIGVSGFVTWQSLLRPGDRIVTPLNRAPDAFILFIAQLFINALWTPVFFGLRSILGGAVIIVLLWLAIAGNALLFMRISRTAALLLVPYLAWVTFAGILNWTIWVLNR